VIICGSVLTAATAFADTTQVTLAPGAKTVALKQDEAQQYIQGLAYSFSTSAGLNYTEQLTVKSYATNASPVITLSITGELCRPNKYKLDLGGNGILISDGVRNIAMDSTKLHYARYTASGNLTLGEHWSFISTNILEAASGLDQSLMAYLYAHINDSSFLHPTQMQMTGAKVTLNGKTYIDIEYKGKGDDIHLKLDPVTYALQGADATYTDSTGRPSEAIETVSAMTPLTVSPPAADFSTAPPPGSVAVPIPKDTPPVQKQPAAPKTPKQPHQRIRGGFHMYQLP